ncbi:MAG: hypothetical protein K9L57_10260 [Spirochaetaceae bacterium]|nr:hypothetical protein [Spirochaetia bacterium]MCF7952006.1 hypothetical protein [Spirochaetaceae bacterium]
MDSTLFLVNLTEMKGYLGFTDDDADRDNQLGLFINLVSSLCELNTDRYFLEQEFTEYHNGSTSDRILLHQYPVIIDESTIQVWIDTDRDFGADTLIDSDDLVLDQSNGILYYAGGAWGVGVRHIKVTYTAGYTVIPYALRLSVMEAVAFFWKRKNEKSWGLSSISKGEGSITRFQTALPETVKEVWNRYRRER